MATWTLRRAREEDTPAIAELIPLSVRGLQAQHYSAAQMEAAIGSAFGVDEQLIRDGTYFVAVTNDGAVVGCGGWSKRQTLYGSHHHHAIRNDSELDPGKDAARVRAFFVHPDWARRGLARAIVERCEKDIRAAGFSRIELAATLPGVPFYQATGYSLGEREDVPLPGGVTLGIVHMSKALPPA
jgi:N-acetylglutamate synthase-like GNAT family acetyltransferase